MQIAFHKYHGNGNDFILIDNRKNDFPASDTKLINALCNRNFGIGADGLMLLENKAGFDFQMVYFNSDGREGTMCGNGGRCIVQYAARLGLIDNSAIFSGNDGPHEAKIDKKGIVHLKMQDVAEIEKEGHAYIIDTGSPHYVVFTGIPDKIDIIKRGRKIRYSEKYKINGINVNFVQVKESGIKIRTYERGVENETLACGTGSVAAVLAMAIKTGYSGNRLNVETCGGSMEVSFRKTGRTSFDDIWLIGPAILVFEGKTDTVFFDS